MTPPRKKKPKKMAPVEPDYLLELAEIALRNTSPPEETRATARELRERNKALRKANQELLDSARARAKKLGKK